MFAKRLLHDIMLIREKMKSDADQFVGKDVITSIE